MLYVSQVREVPGITIFRSSATMYFANAELYLEALKKKVNCFVWNIKIVIRKVHIIFIILLICIITASVYTERSGHWKDAHLQTQTRGQAETSREESREKSTKRGQKTGCLKRFHGY